MLSHKELQSYYQYALALCAHPDDAYDLLNTSVEKYWKRRNSIDSHGAYIRKSIKNAWIDTLKNHRDVVEYEEFFAFDVDSKSLENLVIDESQLQYVWRSIKPLERELLYYWAVLGYSISEISVELDTPRGTLLARIHRMRKRLIEKNIDMGVFSEAVHSVS